MSCTASRRHAGFTLAEILMVMAIVTLAVIVSGNTMLDQLRAQRVGSAIEQARDIASVIEPVRAVLISSAPSRFNSSYDETLEDFMEDMTSSSSLITLRDRFLGGIVVDEDVLGRPAGSSYRIQFTNNATFVVLQANGEDYQSIHFNSAARQDVSAGVRWTVPSRMPSALSKDYLDFSRLDNSQ